MQDDPDAGRTIPRIPTNLRLLAILEAVTRQGGPVAPGDVGPELDLPKPTIHRLFQTLEGAGFLQREPDGRSYTIGPRMRMLATGVLSTARMRTPRLAVMRALSRAIGETVNLSIPDRGAMLYLDRVETEWPLRIQLPVGSRVPLHCTAAGKLHLSTLPPAHLERFLRNDPLARHTANTLTTAAALREEISGIGRAGHARDNEEFIAGMIAIAVPLRDGHGRMPASLSFHAPTQRMPMATALIHLPRLQAAAGELSLLL